MFYHSLETFRYFLSGHPRHDYIQDKQIDLLSIFDMIDNNPPGVCKISANKLIT